MKITTATQRYRAVSLAFLRFLTADNPGLGRKPRHACNEIVEHLGNPGPDPTPSEGRWLKTLDSMIAAELGENGEDAQEDER